jgi:hypothetical protein
LRRIVIIGTALAVLGAAATASAASPFNTYTAKFSASPSKAGSPSKPVPIGMESVLTAQGTNGNRAAPLIDLKSTVDGVKYDSKAVTATCSFMKISMLKNDATCPKGALVATANVNSLLGPASNPALNAVDPTTGKPAVTPCNPGLDVWNAGPGKLTFFFFSTTMPGSAHYCGGVATGATPPYTGTIKQSGKNVVIDVPLPSYVSNRVLGAALWGSLIKEDITWKKIVHGSHAMFAAIGCKGGKRNWTQLFTADFTNAADTGGTIQSFTAKGSMKCS